MPSDTRENKRIINWLRSIASILLGVIILLIAQSNLMAAMPTPSRDDQFLVGVHRIVVVAGTGLDPVLGLNAAANPQVNYHSIEADAISQMKQDLPTRTIDKIEFLSATDLDSSANFLGSDILIISIRVGYRRVITANKSILLGAIYTTAGRPRSSEEEPSKRIGFHAELVQRAIPFPFLLDDDGTPLTEDLHQAERQSLGPIIQWINSSNI
jgi:hypothetical protein